MLFALWTTSLTKNLTLLPQGKLPVCTWKIISDQNSQNSAKWFILNHVMSNPAFCIYEKTSCAVTVKLISAFVFATWIVQSIYFLNPKFQAYSHFLWLYSLVFVGPSRKPRRQVFPSYHSNDNASILDAAPKFFHSQSDKLLPKQEQLLSVPYEPCHEKTCIWGFLTMSNTNRVVQPQKMVERLEISDFGRRGIILFMLRKQRR